MHFAIALHALSKRYGRLEALRGASFDVERGEVFGFLGPNGSGKTTTIRLLLDLIRPTSGNAEIFGMDCRRRSGEVRARVGYLPGELALYGDMTGHETLELLMRLSGSARDTSLRDALLEQLAFPHSDLRRRVREYSTGMRRKLGIVQAMQHDPPLLILDEPTEGLDPLMQEAFYAIIADARARGTTIFMSSHILHEVDRTCDRLALLRGGEVVLVATVDDVRKLAPRLVRITFDADVPPPALTDAFEIDEAAPRLWRVRATGELRELMAAASQHAIRDVEIDTPRLEDVIFRYYSGGAR